MENLNAEVSGQRIGLKREALRQPQRSHNPEVQLSMIYDYSYITVFLLPPSTFLLTTRQINAQTRLVLMSTSLFPLHFGFVALFQIFCSFSYRNCRYAILENACQFKQMHFMKVQSSKYFFISFLVIWCVSNCPAGQFLPLMPVWPVLMLGVSSSCVSMC